MKFKEGDKVWDLVLEEMGIVIEVASSYRIRMDNGESWWIDDDDLISEELYESPLYQALLEE
jgi:hypothetical protein